MRYFSTFSGIGGFEKGIELAYESLCDAHGSENRICKEDSERDERQRFFTTERKDTGSTERPASERPTDMPYERPLCIGFSEIDKYAVQIYQSHFPHEQCETCRLRRIQSDNSERPEQLNNASDELEQRELPTNCQCKHKPYGDITKINADELPDFDLLVGGFPCQSFSIAGKRRGFEDTRGTMFFELARILRAKQPRLFVFENVKGLLSHDNGQTFATIIQTLDELGYDCQWQVLNSKNHGVPQNRERVFIIGHLRGTPRPQVFPFGEDNRSNNEQGELRTRRELLEGDELHSIQEEEKETVSKSGGQIIRKDWNQPDNTDSRGGSTHPTYRIRRLTPTECMRLQGFPDDWCDGISDTQKYKCAGNAVTVNVIRDIFTRML